MATNISIRFVVRDYDLVSPLLKGDVVPDGIKLTLDRTTPILHFPSDQSFDAGETSMSKYLIALSKGDREMIGIPFFPMRAFRHRCFFVRRDSQLKSFKDLDGKRIGTNGWADTGNTWCRAAMKDQDVDLSTISWWVGSIDGVTDEKYGHRASPNVPAGITFVGDQRTLLEMLLADELDALMVPWPPHTFYEPGSPVVRLFPNYRAIEQDYFQRTGLFPAHHLVGIRRTVAEEHPWVVRSLYDALSRASAKSHETRWRLTDISPWTLAELEETASVFGQDWNPSGVAANRKMIEAFCEEQWTQGLVERKVDPTTVFSEFERLSAETV